MPACRVWPWTEWLLRSFKTTQSFSLSVLFGRSIHKHLHCPEVRHEGIQSVSSFCLATEHFFALAIVIKVSTQWWYLQTRWPDRALMKDICFHSLNLFIYHHRVEAQFEISYLLTTTYLVCRCLVHPSANYLLKLDQAPMCICFMHSPMARHVSSTFLPVCKQWSRHIGGLRIVLNVTGEFRHPPPARDACIITPLKKQPWARQSWGPILSTSHYCFFTLYSINNCKHLMTTYTYGLQSPWFIFLSTAPSQTFPSSQYQTPFSLLPSAIPLNLRREKEHQFIDRIGSRIESSGKMSMQHQKLRCVARFPLNIMIAEGWALKE